jgi:hypothetical protein
MGKGMWHIWGRNEMHTWFWFRNVMEIITARSGNRWEYDIDITVFFRVKWVPVTTAWRVLGLRMEERPPVVEDCCEYIE